MRLPPRIALLALGLVAVVYSAASLTGGWLGTPPWWWTETQASDVTVFGATQRLGLEELRKGREWISGDVIVAGLAVAAFGTLSRRHRERVA